MFGVSLFTTFPVSEVGRIPFWQKHQQRIKAWAQAWDIPLPEHFLINLPDQSRREIIQGLIKKNAISQTAVGRYRISPGEVGAGLPGSKAISSPREFFDLRPLPQKKTFTNLQVLKTRRNSAEEVLRPKSGNYLNSWLAHRELFGMDNQEPTEGLMLDKMENLSEGTVSNLFWIRAGEIETPSTSTGCLEGSTLDWVKEFCRESRISCTEGEWPLTYLSSKAIEAIFVCNAVQGFMPVKKVINQQGQVVKECPRSPTSNLANAIIEAYEKARQDSFR